MNDDLIPVEMLHQWAEARMQDYALIIEINLLVVLVATQMLLLACGLKKTGYVFGALPALAVFLLPGNVALASGLIYIVSMAVCFFRSFREQEQRVREAA